MKTKKVLLKSINWLLAGILTLLGFTGCEKNGVDEYGVPYADYTIKGEVVNKATGKPVEGIQVGYYFGCWGCMYGVILTPYVPKARVLTNAKGEFKLTDRFSLGEVQVEEGRITLPVSVEDIDGEKNGLFFSKFLQVDMSKAEPSGKPKKWYDGEYTVNVKIELTEIEQETNE